MRYTPGGGLGIMKPPWYYMAATPGYLRYFATNVAPQTEQVRDSYTVSGGRRAFVHSVYFQIQRHTLASTTAPVGIRLKVSLRGGSYYTVVALERVINFPQQIESLVVPLGMLVGGGDILQLTTVDYNDDGRVNYAAYVSYTEFDLS